MIIISEVVVRARGHIGKVKELKMAETLNKITHESLMKKMIFEQWAVEDWE